jgi:hypothetical protein
MGIFRLRFCVSVSAGVVWEDAYKAVRVIEEESTVPRDEDGVLGRGRFAKADLRCVDWVVVERCVVGLAGFGRRLGALEKGEMLIALITVRPAKQRQYL